MSHPGATLRWLQTKQHIRGGRRDGDGQPGCSSARSFLYISRSPPARSTPHSLVSSCGGHLLSSPHQHQHRTTTTHNKRVFTTAPPHQLIYVLDRTGPCRLRLSSSHWAASQWAATSLTCASPRCRLSRTCGLWSVRQATSIHPYIFVPILCPLALADCRRRYKSDVAPHPSSPSTPTHASIPPPVPRLPVYLRTLSITGAPRQLLPPLLRQRGRTV
jgi:hypothetical protein